MGIKGDKKSSTDQLRMARLTLEGNSAADDEITLQKLIKKITEMTSCTHAQAEIALLDNNNDIQAAIEHILESETLDSWTESKGAKKEKKKQDEDRVTTRTFVQRGRGAGGFSDRGNRGRSNGAPRENYRENRENTREVVSGSTRPTRGGFDRPSTFSGRGGRGGGRGGYSRPAPTESSIPSEEKTSSNRVETNVNEVQKPVEEFATTTVTTSSAPAPMSFAAIAAAAHRKEELRRQQLQNPQEAVSKRRSVSPVPPPAFVEETYEEPESSHHEEEKAEESFYQNESSTLPEEPLASVSTNVDEDVQNSPSQANVWTKQLKSELGIGIGETPSLAPPSPIPSNVSILSLPDPGVEFVGAEPTGIHDYSFGYVDTPQPPILPPAETSSASISTNNSDNLFNSSRISAPPKPVEPERALLSNGDFNMKSTSPPTPYGQPNRTLSYDTSSVSYAPTDRGLPTVNKAQFPQSVQLPGQQTQQLPGQQTQQLPGQQATQLPGQQNQQLQQQQQQQPSQSQQGSQQPAAQPQQQPHSQANPHHPQALMFSQHLPYGPYSYMNMYNPGGVREDQYAALMQYGMGVDLTNLSTILPQATQIPQAAPTQQLHSAQQRQDSQGLMDFNKFASQGSRDQQQQSNVGPPPGFQQPSYMTQPNLSSLFMQQPYGNAPHAFGFMNMMPSVGNNGGGRQMYGQEDERKSYDKMPSKPAAQPNPHSQYQHNGGNLGMYQNKKGYNWNN